MILVLGDRINAANTLYAVLRIYDRSMTSVIMSGDTGSTINTEVGCEKYDKAYNESIVLDYIWTSESTDTYNSSIPLYPPNFIDDPLYIEAPLEQSNYPYLVSTVIGTLEL